MRPLRLKLENFTCFGDGPVAVDFTSLELFAITGRTGAGKSSLLDAMISRSTAVSRASVQRG